ncbi:MAG: bifunctional adenosylcobinamide kinase/adenosylcobinamide-phosphate guanylyltransferase, partial [Bacillota bacterium]
CLTLFVTNHLLRETPPDDAAGDKQRKQRERVWTAVEELVSAAKSVPACVLVVTNEVGWGIVPDNVLSRLFRDVAGLANQRLAAAADDVYMLVSGLPLRLKSLKH